MPTAILLLIIGFGYFFFSTNFTGLLFRPCSGLCDVYDSLGQNLLKFHVDVDPASLQHELVLVNGKAVTYFGLLPGVFRIFENLLASGMFGRWTIFNLFVAGLLSVSAVSAIVNRSLAVNPDLSESDRGTFLKISVLTFAFGTPALFLISRAQIYHEAILWGLCFSLWSIFFLIQILREGGTETDKLLFSILAGCSLLSRVTFGVPLCLISMALMFNSYRLRRVSKKSDGWGRELFALAMPTFTAIFIQLWYNFERFNSLFRFVPEGFTYLKFGAVGGFWNIARIPSNFFNYFGFRADFLWPTPPFVNMPTAYLFRPELFTPNYGDRVLSLSFSSPWLVAGSIIGLIHVIRKWRLSREWSTLFSLLCFLSQSVLILTFHHNAQKYAAEFLPFIVFGYAYFLSSFNPNTKFGSCIKQIAIPISILSCFITIAGTAKWLADCNGMTSPSFVTFMKWAGGL